MGGHWGTIKCPTGACSQSVFATGNSTENVARDTEKKIERCPHGNSGRRKFVEAEELLTQAERLLVALETQLEQEATRARLDELLELVDSSFGTARKAVEDEFDELSQRATHDGLAEMLAPTRAVTLVASKLWQVKRRLRSVSSRSPQHGPLFRRLEGLEARLELVRARLKENL